MDARRAMLFAPLADRRPGRLTTFVCALALCGSGCRITLPENAPGGRLHASEDVAMNSEQVRQCMRAQVQPLSGIIVEAADRVIAGTPDPGLRRRALLWKIEAVPALREALFRPDSYVALFDAWAMSWQMTGYFTDGPGSAAFGEARVIAASACKHLEEEITRVAAGFTISKDVSDVREAAHKWANAHPILSSIAHRDSILSRTGDLEVPTSFSAAEAMGNLTVTVEDLNRRLEIYSAQLLDQSRWEAELFAMDTVREYQLDQALPIAQSGLKTAGHAVESLDRILPELERALAVVERAPGLIAGEREAAITKLSAELTRSLETLKEERIAAIHDLHGALVEERQAITEDFEQLGLKTLDRAFGRALLLLAAAGVFALACVLIVPRLRGRPRVQ